MQRFAKSFNLMLQEKEYSDLVNEPRVIVLEKTDGLSKEGDPIRVIDYIKLEEAVYTPPQ